NLPIYKRPRVNLQCHRPLTMAFAGTVWPGYRNILETIALSLQTTGGKLLIYSDPEDSEVEKLSQLKPVIELKGFVPVEQLVTDFHTHADVLIAVMDCSLGADQK